LLLLALGVTASYYWSPTVPDSIDPLNSARQAALPQTYLRNLRSVNYDENGALTDILEATSVYRFAHGNESLLENPRFYIHSDDNRTWSSTSRSGRYLHKREVLLLSGDVVLINDQSKTRLTTQSMRIDIRRKIASSNVAVTILQGTNSTRADSMVANLTTEKIRMTSNVESIYVQP